MASAGNDLLSAQALLDVSLPSYANGYRGKVDLVYIDPPFDSGADYVRKITLRGPKGTAKLDGEQ